MGIRKYKPTTPGRRQGSVSDFAEITDRQKPPEKTLLEPHKQKGGRNFQGVTCTRFRGGGHKKMYRIIDFKRVKDNVWATVVSIEYDPNRTCRIALLHYADGEKAYILAPDKLEVGEWVLAVGNPFNLESTVTAGIISAKGRNINILKGKGTIESYLQTDAAVNPCFAMTGSPFTDAAKMWRRFVRDLEGVDVKQPASFRWRAEWTPSDG